MIDLGLESLTDDQLAELHTAIYAEVLRRDIALVAVAQQRVWDSNAKAQFARQALVEALSDGMEAEKQTIKTDVAKEVKRAYKAGELRLLDPRQESELIAEADIDARIALIDAELQKLEHGQNVEFCLQLSKTEAYVSNGQTVERVRLPRPMEVGVITGYIRQLLRG